MKIKWVTWWPVPYWTDRYNALAACPGVELEVLFLAQGSKLLPVSVRPSDWHFDYRYLSEGSDHSGYYQRVFRLKSPRLLYGGRFDALVMTYSDPTCIVAAFVCFLLGKRFFFFTGNTADDHRRTNWWLEMFKRGLMRMANGILVSGSAQREYVERYVGNRTRIWEIGNPVKKKGAEKILPQRSALREKFGLSARDVVILFVGRLSEEKGLTTLLSALGECYAGGLAPKLRLVGTGPAEGTLRDHAARANLQVTFCGFLEGTDLAEQYAIADIFALPSLSEPWGLVVNEAMEFGLPLLLSTYVGCRPVLLREMENGLSFEAGNSAALASAIQKLVIDADLRGRMGQASRKLIKEHSLEKWSECVLRAVRRAQN